ncbi:hypothetical protein M3Y98_00408300 [Aphelenchoides besseyi]|nr:hypothetical protein M3Y98_00408300 [Aphelenchoides besseyi]
MTETSQLGTFALNQLLRFLVEKERPPSCNESWIDPATNDSKCPPSWRFLLINRKILFNFTSNGKIGVAVDETFLRLSNGKQEVRFDKLKALDGIMKLLKPSDMFVICDDENFYGNGEDSVYGQAYRKLCYTIKSWSFVQTLELKFDGKTAFDEERIILLKELAGNVTSLIGSSEMIPLIESFNKLEKLVLFSFSDIKRVRPALAMKVKEIQLQGVYLDEVNQIDSFPINNVLRNLELGIQRPGVYPPKTWPTEKEEKMTLNEKWMQGIEKLRNLSPLKPFLRLVYREELTYDLETLDECVKAVEFMIEKVNELMNGNAEIMEVVKSVELHPLISNYKFEREALLHEAYEKLPIVN